MKTSLKIGLLALLIGSAVFACDPPKANSTQPTIDSPRKPIDTSAKAKLDTSKKDTTKNK